MKRYFILLLVWLALGSPAPQTLWAQETLHFAGQGVSLDNLIGALDGVTEVNRLESSLFQEKYEVMIRQPLDGNDPSAGTFGQRFYVLHRGRDLPVVYVTEGYRGSYAANPRFTNEIAERYNANVVLLEHRYFERSTPEPRNWDYLTVENSMHDLHRVRTAMADIYPGKWIATGISKGGQTTIMYATYFPGDVDVYVPYVGPVCFGVEDGRHEPFIDRSGTSEERAKIRAFQFGVLERRAEIQPLFDKFCNEKELKFRISLEEVYDYCVLEYPFAFRQWGYPTDRIPAPGAEPQALLDHLLYVAGPDYFAVSDEPSFYVQAVRELGYYGYDTRPFRGLLSIRSAKGYLRKIMLPEDAQHYKFSSRVYRDVYKYLKNNDPRMIAVNGEFDPWNAVSLDRRLFRNKENMLLMVDEAGSHRARISTLSEEQQAEVWRRIDQWLAE